MIRTRLAPSPTGYLHIGTARTALFNYLFAKRNGGSFILRIEDTDRERSRKEFEDDILDGLSWLKLCWDEGPRVGGKYGPYYQRERLDIYETHLKALTADGILYPCFCTKEELERERELQVLSRKPPRYSGKCRALTDADRHARKQEGRLSTLRFKVESRVFSVNDLVRGELAFDTASLDDFIVAKDFRNPLYNFAVVVDDHLMNITHVIRGEEHISNIPKQVLLAEALQFTVPQFAHLSLILNADRTKLSKRQNKVSLLEYRDDGYLPEAIDNFIALLGWNPGGTRELFTLEELAEAFDLSAVHKAGAIFDLKKLDWFNNHYIRELSDDTLVDHAVGALQKGGLISTADGEWYTSNTGERIARGFIQKIARVERERLKKFSELPELADFFFAKDLSYDADLLLWKGMTNAETTASLEFSERILADADNFTAETLEHLLKDEIVREGKQNGTILWPLRVALTGKKFSPPPFDVAEIIGKKKTLLRIAEAKKLLATA